MLKEQMRDLRGVLVSMGQNTGKGERIRNKPKLKAALAFPAALYPEAFFSRHKPQP